MLTSKRREEILRAVLHQLETAGPAGFAFMCYFGMLRRRHGPGPMAIRRAANIYNIVEAIAGSKDPDAIETARWDFDEFKAGLDELTCDRIEDAGNVWRDIMARFWARESARMYVALAKE